MSETTLDTVPPTASTEAVLKKVQAIAGSLFAVFVTLHLSNIFIAPLGIEAFNGYQEVIRALYQHPFIEVLLVIGPLVTHMVAGVWVAVIRRKRNPSRPLRLRLHTWAGVFLFVVILGHITAVRGPSYFYDVYPGFEGIAFSLWYLPAWFYPYYFLLALAGFYHATGGLNLLAARRGVSISPAAHRNLSLLAAVIIVISLLALGGHLYDVGDPADNDFARLYGELLGIDTTRPFGHAAD